MVRIAVCTFQVRYVEEEIFLQEEGAVLRKTLAMRVKGTVMDLLTEESTMEMLVVRVISYVEVTIAESLAPIIMKKMTAVKNHQAAAAL